MDWSERTAKEIERGTSAEVIATQTEKQRVRIEGMTSAELAYRLVQAGAIAAWLDTWTAMLVERAQTPQHLNQVLEVLRPHAHGSLDDLDDRTMRG